jgi:dienelactone hydrolase
MNRGFHYVVFPSLHEKPLAIAARLGVPSEATRPMAAVVILHGSAGPTAREAGYAQALNDVGIATLEPDQWAPRQLEGGASGRPRTVAETLPDVFGAHKFLAANPSVDPRRIGLMGFSFGGIATFLAATKTQSALFATSGPFAAFMPCYPICWMYGKVRGHELSPLSGAPVFLLTAELDQYDNDSCAGENLVASLPPSDRAIVRTRAMADCHHGFDMPGADLKANDPASHRGAGGTAIMRYNGPATAEAHKLAAEFFLDALKRH